jgi:hypothetical protein
LQLTSKLERKKKLTNTNETQMKQSQLKEIQMKQLQLKEIQMKEILNTLPHNQKQKTYVVPTSFSLEVLESWYCWQVNFN